MLAAARCSPMSPYACNAIRFPRDDRVEISDRSFLSNNGSNLRIRDSTSPLLPSLPLLAENVNEICRDVTAREPAPVADCSDVTSRSALNLLVILIDTDRDTAVTRIPMRAKQMQVDARRSARPD